MPDKTTSMLYPERPLPGDQESAERDAVVDKLVRLIEEVEPKDKLTVIGLYGPRGSGKTSVLYRLIHRVGSPGGLVLPQADQDDHADPGPDGKVFDPGLALDSKELPFDLIAFLRRFGTPSDEGLAEAEGALANMDDPERYLDLESALTPSADRLPERIAKRRVALAGADKVLRKALGRWGKATLSARRGARLLLLIDDLDLRPELSFRLLDLLIRYLADVPCVAVLCADDPTLRGAVEVAMWERQSRPELASALLAKYVPLSVSLPPWSAGEATRFLLLGDGRPSALGGRGELPTLDPFMKALRRAQRTALVDWETLPEVEWGQSPEDHWAWLIGRLAPRLPRQLKRLHNRIWLEINLWTGDDPRHTLSRWRAAEGISSLDAVRTIFIALLMVDERHPELGLWRRAVALDPPLLRELGRGADVWWWTPDDPALVATEHGEADSLKAADSLLLRFVDRSVADKWSAEERADVAERLVLLAYVVAPTLGWVRRRNRVLAISLDADAEEIARRHLDVEMVEALDLRDGQPTRPPVSALWSRLTQQRARLRELSVALRGRGLLPVGVVGKAPASVLCWLGWNLRYTALRRVYNDHNGELTEFLLPSSRLEPRYDRDGLGLFRKRDLLIPPRPDQEGAQPPGDERVLVIDTLRKVNDTDITERFEVSSRPMSARLLQMKDIGRVMEPNDYDTVLQDLLDHINHMRSVEGVRVFHLALVVQDVVAFGLGRQLHSQGVFHLYEWERASQRYVRMGTFPDDDSFAEEETPPSVEEPSAEEPNVVRRGAS